MDRVAVSNCSASVAHPWRTCQRQVQGPLRVAKPAPVRRSRSFKPARAEAEQPAQAPPADAPPAPQAASQPEVEETTFYEGSGAPGELVVSLILGATLVYLPLTMASIGRRLWVKYRFTNKRLIVTTSSPIFQREVQVEYKNIKEIRTAPRAFGLWGDMVIFLKDGSRLELVGLEKCMEIKDYILGQMPF